MKLVEFLYFAHELRLVLSDVNLSEALNKLINRHVCKLYCFHGLSTPNLMRASRPTRRLMFQSLSRRYSRGERPP